ncbi:hypothetical protein Xen7305DRAFT_00010980 [Xenococcus sp. PCC 7305]|uniref:hypothetical protein n=1 Tax=Xenococcus sp. PCC 7305 TaxID=102125 RepID=UPI0002AC3E2E|nr:hypothetical protein [Xenococcus sp. PCC 7305]ELS01394.1 hypothetical protein Xen7305DRAFT_00010980 [Xenococcus sp. PCC 7305]
MTNPTIETDLADILREIKSDQREILKEISNFKREVDSDQKAILKEISDFKKEVDSDQKAILKEISDVKVELAEVRGDIKSLDTKVEQLDKRIANQEFINRGVLVGLILVMLGGLAKIFELGIFK